MTGQAEDCKCLHKALLADTDSAAEQFTNTVLLREAVQDLAKVRVLPALRSSCDGSQLRACRLLQAREELAAERQAAAAAHEKHQMFRADTESRRAALQRDLAVFAELIKAKEASAADERSAASAAQAALRTQLDAAEACLLGWPARCLNSRCTCMDD